MIKLIRYISVSFLIIIFLFISLREYTHFGSLAVFFLLMILSIPALIMTRYLATISILLLSLIYIINYADKIKYELTKLHLSYADFNIIFQFVWEFDLSLFSQYNDVVLFFAFISLFSAVIIGVLAYFERRSDKPKVVLGLVRAMCLVPLSVLALNLFLQSSYMQAVRSQIPQRMSADVGPLRASAFLAEISEGYMLAARLAADKAAFPASAPEASVTNCLECPDLIIVHLESVYDPRFERAYADAEPFAKLFGSRLQRWASLLRVHNWGGPSVITEFEFLCSLRHELFGWAGLHPHVKVGPYISGCLGNELKNHGYEGAAVYTASGSFSGVQAAFNNYGLTTFHDPAALSLPSDWSKLRDQIIFDALKSLLDQTRTAPRFYWVSTIWNHGPHGTDRVTEQFDGPYDVSRADSNPLEDYINRLNDTVVAVRNLEAYLAESAVPTILVLFGDHHPAFPKQYAPIIEAEFPDLDYLTPFVVLRNFAGPDIPETDIVDVQDAAYYLSRLAGVSLPSAEKIFQLKAKCEGDEITCANAIKSEMRATQLR